MHDGPKLVWSVLLWFRSLLVYLLLCSQLFGEEDPDQDVSPDTEDPELAAEAGQAALGSEAKSDTAGGIERKSTRGWAEETGYNALKIYNKVWYVTAV